MSETIWKFPLAVTDVQQVDVPAPAEPLSVQVQGGVPCMWARVVAPGQRRSLEVFTFGTGHTLSLPVASHFLGTYQLDDGALVFHVFWRMLPPAPVQPDTPDAEETP